MKVLGIAAGIIAGLMLVATIGTGDLSGLIGVLFWAAICWAAIKKAKDPVRQERIQAKKSEKAAEKAAEKERKEAEKAVKKEKQAEAAKEWLKQREEDRLAKARDNNPVAAVVITAQDKTKTSGGLGRAVVGGMIAGPVGAVVGASTGKRKTEVTGQKVTFSVKYESGRTGVETVDVNSKRFRELSALLVK